MHSVRLSNFPDQAKALFPEWKTADLLFQLTDQELSRESSLFTDDSVQRGLLKSYIFIAIELKGTDHARQGPPPHPAQRIASSK